ncbi:hypothetical protein [Aidingimonas halophila]|uniref:Uncharacterized protein n=1 Tax=Aidingimonas halophila TaxID=574349 RepID=A0A1H2ZVA9_9GAMM|nr:hypothetical protein [Aidingimonas halophila]GHC16815.1 hypothetical protein GCM10008094_02710 [Aidingimonas halophila]SDX21530.1 hypothetical protein SAMN05443545_104274 [Aidingimonas halophila]
MDNRSDTVAAILVIYGIKEHLNPVKAQLSEVIHGCMQSVLGMPEDKRAIVSSRWMRRIFITRAAEHQPTLSLRST